MRQESAPINSLQFQHTSHNNSKRFDRNLRLNLDPVSPRSNDNHVGGWSYLWVFCFSFFFFFSPFCNSILYFTPPPHPAFLLLLFCLEFQIIRVYGNIFRRNFLRFSQPADYWFWVFLFHKFSILLTLLDAAGHIENFSLCTSPSRPPLTLRGVGAVVLLLLSHLDSIHTVFEAISVVLVLCCWIPTASPRFEKDRQNIDSFRGFLEKFSLFFFEPKWSPNNHLSPFTHPFEITPQTYHLSLEQSTGPTSSRYAGEGISIQYVINFPFPFFNSDLTPLANEWNVE